MHKLRTIEMQRLSVDEFHEANKLPLNRGARRRALAPQRRFGVPFLRRLSARSRLPLRHHRLPPPHPRDSQDGTRRRGLRGWRYFETATEAVAELQKEGVFVYSIEQVEGSTKLQNLQLDTDRRYAVVFGNEVKGVHQEVVDLADGCLEIPQFGTKHSLNVSVTAGIVIWEVAKQFLERLKL